MVARTTLIGIERGFILRDEAIKLTGEMRSKSLQEYRATRFGYLAQTFDVVLGRGFCLSLGRGFRFFSPSRADAIFRFVYPNFSRSAYLTKGVTISENCVKPERPI